MEGGGCGFSEGRGECLVRGWGIVWWLAIKSYGS